jgi:small-conductance mechanosensitive channel
VDARVRLLVVVLVGLVGTNVVFSQISPVNGPDSFHIIQFLNQTIAWDRELAVQQKIATEPTDVMVVYDNHQTADQVVRLAFDFARVEAESISKQVSPTQEQGDASSQYQSLRQLEAKLDKQVQDTQAELDSTKHKLATGTGTKRQELQSQALELQGEIELAGARRDAVRSMVEFVSGAGTNGLGATGLRAQIEALASSVPAVSPSTIASQGGSSSGAVPNPGSTLVPSKPEASGIWDLAADIFSLSAKVHTIESIIRQTNALAKTAQALKAPLVTQLTELSKQGDELANQADTANQAKLAQERQQLDALAKQFTQISAAAIPLSKQGVLLDVYGRSLSNWRDAIRSQYKNDLEKLGIRVGFLAIILVIVIGAAELWRRAVYHYAHDSHRRYQLLLLRKFVLWTVIAVIVAFAFASRLGSIVTFAGLITAGVAVALQNVILSIAGYFFLIGKYGIRVGDRVQIGGVVGEVIDVGLVRIHLMELSGGAASGPTGRVVAFSNSIVFQATAGLFKQLPGINFAWHEITLTLSSKEDHTATKEKFLKAVGVALADYQDEIGRQNREIQRTAISAPRNSLQPTIQLRFLPSGVEAVIRYPVDLQHAAEIDERVSQELLKAFDHEPKLKVAGTASHDIRLRTEVTTSESKS